MFAVDGEQKLPALSSSGQLLGWLLSRWALILRGEAANAGESFDLGLYSS